MKRNQDDAKLTILYREDAWKNTETYSLTNLAGTVFRHGSYPNYLILCGHYTEIEILNTLALCTPCKVTQVVGCDNEQLPFPIE
ncbi:MAG: hypothetical protein RIQ54_87 [Candidatus Parcubacteria bacterium]|jgi:hypothetical protein